MFIEGDMGWSTFRDRIMKHKLRFPKKTERLSNKKMNKENIEEYELI